MHEHTRVHICPKEHYLCVPPGAVAGEAVLRLRDLQPEDTTAHVATIMCEEFVAEISADQSANSSLLHVLPFTTCVIHDDQGHHYCS